MMVCEGHARLDKRPAGSGLNVAAMRQGSAPTRSRYSSRRSLAAVHSRHKMGGPASARGLRRLTIPSLGPNHIDMPGPQGSVAVTPSVPRSYFGFGLARKVVDSTGTAGWIRTTDLLIHSQQQAIDFPTVGSKPNFALLKINVKIGSPVAFQLPRISPSDRARVRGTTIPRFLPAQPDWRTTLSRRVELMLRHAAESMPPRSMLNQLNKLLLGEPGTGLRAFE